jgi:HEAT repeat protein
VIEVALEQFDAPDGDVRWAAAAILTPVARVIEDLRLRLRDLAASGATTTRKMALLVLADAGERDLDLYIRGLRDDDGYVRLAALRALGRIGNGSPSVVEALAQAAASDSDERIRRAAAVIAARLATIAAKE